MEKSSTFRMNSTSSLENSKPPGVGLKLSAPGRIAAQSENILDAQFPNLAQQLADLLARRADTGQVGDRGQAVRRWMRSTIIKVFSRVLPPAP